MFTDQDLAAIQQDLDKQFDIAIEFYVRSEIETVVGSKDYVSFSHLLDDFRQRNRSEYGTQIRQSVLNSR